MSGRRTAYRRGAGSRWMDLRYAGVCKVCGFGVAAGDRAYWDAAARTVTCWKLSCCEADGLTEQAYHGPAGTVTVRRAYRIGAGAPSVIASRFNSGATTHHNARGRCEDAPCCGCCD